MQEHSPRLLRYLNSASLTGMATPRQPMEYSRPLEHCTTSQFAANTETPLSAPVRYSTHPADWLVAEIRHTGCEYSGTSGCQGAAEPCKVCSEGTSHHQCWCTDPSRDYAQLGSKCGWHTQREDGGQGGTRSHSSTTEHSILG